MVSHGQLHWSPLCFSLFLLIFCWGCCHFWVFKAPDITLPNADRCGSLPGPPLQITQKKSLFFFFFCRTQNKYDILIPYNLLLGPTYHPNLTTTILYSFRPLLKTNSLWGSLPYSLFLFLTYIIFDIMNPALRLATSALRSAPLRVYSARNVAFNGFRTYSTAKTQVCYLVELIGGGSLPGHRL